MKDVKIWKGTIAVGTALMIMQGRYYAAYKWNGTMNEGYGAMLQALAKGDREHKVTFERHCHGKKWTVVA